MDFTGDLNKTVKVNFQKQEQNQYNCEYALPSFEVTTILKFKLSEGRVKVASVISPVSSCTVSVCLNVVRSVMLLDGEVLTVTVLPSRTME